MEKVDKRKLTEDDELDLNLLSPEMAQAIILKKRHMKALY